jgi:hypothetical protein
VAVAGTLVANRQAMIKVERDDGTIRAVTVRAPIKGDALKVTRIDRVSEPQLFGTLLVWSAAGEIGTSRLSDAECVRLADIGLLIPPDRVSTPVLFSCDATDSRPGLLPARSAGVREPMADAAVDLRASPTLRRFGADGPPAEMRGRRSLRNPFDPDQSWIMVDDDPMAAPQVYSYGHDAAAILERLDRGRPVPDSVPAQLRQRLLDTGIIESVAERAREREQRVRDAEDAGRLLREQRFVSLPRLVPPLQVAAARRFYRGLIEEGFLPLGDAEWPDRYFATKEPLAHFFHQQLTAVVSRVAGEPVKPSFCVFASYRPGAELPPHRDREQCEYSLSILIDHSPEPTDVSPWPLYLQPPDASAATPVAGGLGDGVLYYGREVTHFRERLIDADFCSFWFFFYVPEGFTGPLD